MQDASVCEFRRDDLLYATLKKKIAEHEAISCTFRELVDIIGNDQSVQWGDIRAHEIENNEKWSAIKPNWKYAILRSLATPGRFLHGGDRRSAATHGAKQTAMIEYSQELALARPLDEDDQQVADGVVDAVEQRYRGVTADAAVIMRRVVRNVTRRVRVRRRHPDTDGSDDDDDTIEITEEQLEEVVVRPTTISLPPSTDHALDPRAFSGLAPEVVRELAALEGKRLELAATVATRHLETQVLLADRQLEMRRQDVCLVHAQTRQMAAVRINQTGQKRTRDRGAAEADNELERLIAEPWRNMQSLTAAVVATTPSSVEAASRVTETRTLCAHVLTWVERMAIDHRRRLLPREPDLIVVYVNIMTDKKELARRFWADRLVIGPTAATPSCTVAPSSTADAVLSQKPTVAPLYCREDVLSDIRFLMSKGIFNNNLGTALCVDAALPRFVPPIPAACDQQGWRQKMLELRAIRTLLGIGDTDDLTPRDHGLLSGLAQRLPGWETHWVKRPVSTTSGKALPLLYAAGSAAGHILRAAELIVAVRHTVGRDYAVAALRGIQQSLQ